MGEASEWVFPSILPTIVLPPAGSGRRSWQKHAGQKNGRQAIDAAGLPRRRLTIAATHKRPFPPLESTRMAGECLGLAMSLKGLHRLHSVSGGIILELEQGYSLWFEEDGMGGFLTPEGEFSTLVENMDGSFTLTMKDGYECHFNSSGRLTSCVIAHNPPVVCSAVVGSTSTLP